MISFVLRWIVKVNARNDILIPFPAPLSLREIVTGSTLYEHSGRGTLKQGCFTNLAKMYGKPICFGECRCTSSYGGAMSPSGWFGEGGYSPMEQANYLEAMLKLFWDEPWWCGLFWWKWDEQNVRPTFSSDSAGDKGFTVYGKPAANIMKHWFSKK